MYTCQHRSINCYRFRKQRIQCLIGLETLTKSKDYTPAEVLNILSEQGVDIHQKVKNSTWRNKSPLLAAMGYKGNSGSDPVMRSLH